MIGQLRHRIKIRSKIRVPDGRGGYTVPAKVLNWPIVATVWGAISPMDGREIQKYLAIYPEVNTRILIRYNGELDAEHIIEYNNKIYEILGFVNPKEEGKINIIAAKEVPKRGKYDS